MEKIADLIDAAKARTSANYSDIGERLERSKQLVTNWRSGAKIPTDGDVLALARMAGQNGDKWLAIAQAARTEGEARTRWEHIAKRLAGAAAVLLCAIGLAGNAAPATAAASTTQRMHIMFGVRWVGHLVGLWLGWKLRKPTRPYIEARV